MLRRIAGKFENAAGRLLRGTPETGGGPVTLPARGPACGKALVSYLTLAFHWPEDDPRFDGHTNAWESREIARIFQELGFEVHGIRHDDRDFTPREKYDVLFDVHGNLQRLAPLVGEKAVKLLHCTGSAASYQNAAHMARVEALRRRRGVDYPPERFLTNEEEQARSLEVADACSLLGNEHTLSTYPERLRGKFTLVPATGSRLDGNVKQAHEFAPPEREFLWFFGGGPVHKGLDLALEVFARNPKRVLNIVGAAKDEPDFLRVYERELTQLLNIRCHGWLRPNGPEFGRVIRKCFCFLAPTCSESMSTAVVTCLQAGLFPVISADTGVTLPAGCGITLPACDIAELESAVRAAFEMKDADLAAQTAETQRYATRECSREKFTAAMTAFLSKVTGATHDDAATASVSFDWNPAEFDVLLKSCAKDDGVKLSLEYLTDRRARILEAGCGSGRVVKYLHDLGFINVCGIELNGETVKWFNARFPELSVVQGDLLRMPFEEGSFDAVLSYGVVEHFPEGLDRPLKALLRVLRPGGMAIVTVPCLNRLRAFRAVRARWRVALNPKCNRWVRALFGKPPIPGPVAPYCAEPPNGPFFEYRLTPRQFEQACKSVGFEIVESLPISHLDGLYHQFGPPLIEFANWEFKVSRAGRMLNSVLKRFPFLHNHMHACVLRKP